MKPEAPEEIRGPFRPIATKVPGIQVSEIFPRLATMMDKVSLVRSVYHTAAAVHDTGHQMMQTGRLFTGGTEHPPYGSVLAKLKGSRHDTPPYVLLPKPIGPTGGNLPHGHAAGYLGKTYDPFILNADPNDKAFKVPDLLPPDYVTAVRESRRRSLRSAIDGAVGSFESSADARLLDANFEGAFKLMSSPQAREAFEIAAEPTAIRDRYGRTRFGQSCLLARRLIERGVRFVTVNMFETVFNEITWDIHGSAPFSPIECYKNEVGPNFDNAYTALLEDLERRGMLETTDGAGVRRVRPDAQGQPGRRPRPSPGLLDRALRRRTRSRAGASSAPPTRSATPPRTGRSPPPRSPRPSITASASTWPPSCPAPRAGRSASSTTASSRSKNSSESRRRPEACDLEGGQMIGRRTMESRIHE